MNGLHIRQGLRVVKHMVTDDGRMNDLSWLETMMKNELDLRPAFLSRIGQNSIFIRNDSGLPIAHAALTNRWQGLEINTVLVDPEYRGEGFSHRLLSEINSKRLFCYTRSPRLQSALIKAGYSKRNFPGLLAAVNLLITRSAIFAWMLLTLDFKRIFHQLRHLPNYKLYMKIDAD